MKSLLRVEIRRFLARRLFKVLSLLVVVGFIATGVGIFITSDNSPDAVAGIEAEQQRQMQACLESFEEGGQAGFIPPGEDPQRFCRDQVFVSDPRFRYEDLLFMLPALAFIFIILGWLVGASFIGAEWHHRTLTTLLTWEPRRARVIAAKALAVAALTFLWIALLELFFAAAVYPAAAYEGTLAGVDGDFWIDVVAIGARIAAAAAIAAVMGFALATAGRNTAAALGVGFVYLAIVEGLIRAFRPKWVGWLIGDNLGAFLQGGEQASYIGHSRTEAALLLVAYAGILLVAATALFKRREMW